MIDETFSLTPLVPAPSVICRCHVVVAGKSGVQQHSKILVTKESNASQNGWNIFAKIIRVLLKLDETPVFANLFLLNLHFESKGQEFFSQSSQRTQREP